MTRKNKKLVKVRQYRDKLLLRITELESQVRRFSAVCREIRRSLQQEDTLRAYALASEEDESEDILADVEKDELAKELALVYRMLAVERNYTYELDRAVGHNDWLRCKALCADHKAEQVAHDKMLGAWSRDHGFTHTLREKADVKEAV